MTTNEKLPGNDYTESEVTSKVAYRGKLLEVREDRIALPDGRPALREYVVHPGAVLIIPLMDGENVLLERQFRYPLRTHFIELPAGKMEADEEPLKTAQRELQEETGYEARRWKHLATTYPCIGYSSEKIELFLAKDLHFVGHRRDEGEFLDAFTLPLRQALDWIRSGEITDIKTIMGLFWAEKILKGEA